MTINDLTNGRVLFVYPNREGTGGIPNQLALLSGCLKQAGFETRCFDTTFLEAPALGHQNRDKHGGRTSQNSEGYWGKWDPALKKKIPGLFLQEIEAFKPDLIAVNVLDMSYSYSIELLTELKKHTSIPVIAGGPTVTNIPDRVIEHDCFDAICIGEGEDALVELAEHIVSGKDYSGIPNLWVKKNGKVIKNKSRPLKNVNQIPFQDWSIFDPRHHYKPYVGKFYKTGFFELARGCPYTCTYCCTPTHREVHDDPQPFVRHRDIDLTLDEICFFKAEYGVELVFFIDDCFLAMPRDRFFYFCEEYKKRVNLPFYIQTRPESAKKEYIEMLGEIDSGTETGKNLSTIALGVEHGNEELRAKVLNRKMSNSVIEDAFDTIHRYNIRTTANMIIGMPYDREELFIDSINLLSRAKPKSVSLNYFMPYTGTKMRDVAVEMGCITEDYIVESSWAIVEVPGFKKDRLKHVYENFMKFVNGESSWDLFQERGHSSVHTDLGVGRT